MSEAKTPKAVLGNSIEIICRRKIQILLVLGITVCTAAIGILTAEPIYQSSAKLLIKVPRQSLESPNLLGGKTPVVKIDRESQINTEIQILKSRFVAEKVIESIGPTIIYDELNAMEAGGDLDHGSINFESDAKSLEQKAIKKLQQNVDVDAIRLTNVIKVKFTHTDRKKAALVLNTLVKVYLDHHLEVHKTPQSHEFFQQQTAAMKDKLNQAEQRFLDFKREHSLTSLTEQRALIIQKKADMQTALHQTRSQIVEAEMRIGELQEQLAITPKTLGLNDPNTLEVNNLQGRLVELELKERELLQKYTAQHPLITNIRNNIQKLQDKLSKAKGYNNTRTQLNPVHQSLQQEYLRNKIDLKALKAKREKQIALLNDYWQELQRLQQIEAEYYLIEEEVEFGRDAYRLYLNKFEEVRVSNAMDAKKIVGVSLIEPARPPIEPVGSQKRLIGMMALVVGGFGGLGLAFILEYFDDRVGKAEDVENYVDLPVLGTISEISS